MVELERSYEQIRLKRVEENKKRMMGLNLNELAQSIRLSSSSPLKPSSIKPRIHRTPVKVTEVRRSSRPKNPPPSYKEVGVESLEKKMKRTCQRKELHNRVYASFEARKSASKRANNLMSSLKPKLPSFVKELTQSHVTLGFWLGLPKEFCLRYLPHDNVPVYLVDENDKESETKYLFGKNGLSAGWRGFAIRHGLVDGDALVFQQIHPTTFKVYITRAYDQANSDSGRIGKKNHVEIIKKQEENVAEATKLRGSQKRKRGGRK